MVKKIVLTIAAVLFACTSLLAQHKQVTGTVTGTDGKPVAGATVVVEGTSIGTSTNLQGKYSLSAPATGTLIFSFIGCEDAKVAINGKSVVDAKLKDSSKAIDDVIVVAYGTAKKESFTGSVAVVGSEEIEKRVVSNVTKALEGQVPGLTATSGSGQPGSGSTISIRGFGSISANSEPLYVVDGVAYGGSISAINPDDIESISVLKDASAGALYGARGANGVIVITTKRGKEGTVDVNLKATLGVSQRAIPRYDLVNQREFVELNWQGLYNDAYFTGGYSDAAARQYASSMLSGVLGANYNPFKNYTWDTLVDPTTGKVHADAKSAWNEDWLDEAENSAAFRQEYQASIAGGNQFHRGSMSISYTNEDGTLRTTKFQRYTGRVSYDTNPKHWFKGGMNANFAHTKTNATQYSGSSALNVFYTAQLMAPIYPVYKKDANGNDVLDANGNRVWDYGENGSRPQNQNSHCIAGLYDDPYNYTSESVSARAYITLGSDDDKAGFLKGLKGSINFGMDYLTTNAMQYMNPHYGNQASNGGLIYRTNTSYMTFTLNELISYDRTFGRHEVSAMVGHEFYRDDYSYLEASRSGLAEGIFEVVGATINSAESSSRTHRIESVFARAKYGFDDRYYLDASWRTDGSSRFAPKTRWGHFWSVGASWRISQEKFLKDVDWLDNLTLRVSYGVQGNEGLDTYYGWQGYYGVYSTGSDIGYAVGQLANESLRWEKNANLNVGLEGSFLKNRLNFSVEYYNRKTTDMLLERPMAFSTGFDSYLDNCGSMRNTGWEMTVSGVLINTKTVRWDLTLMGSTMKNTVLELTPETPEIVEGSYITTPGHAYRSYYLPKFAGVDPATGAALYYAKDKDGKEYITDNTAAASANRYIMGSRTPDLFGSIGTTLAVKGFDLSVLATYSIGGKVLDGTYSSTMNPFYYGETFHRDLLNAWKTPGQVTSVPRVEIGSSQITSDRFLIDASYFAIKNVTLGYTLPKKACNAIGMKSIRIFVSADNLALFTHMKGMNPTYTTYGASGAYTYNPSRSFVGGLDIKF